MNAYSDAKTEVIEAIKERARVARGHEEGGDASRR
jgi:hypothetical protein